MTSQICALLFTLGAIVVGMGLVLLCKRYFKVEGGALLVSVFFAPVVLYLIFSGRLLEFKGYGFEARFKQVAARVVVPSNVRPLAPSASKIREMSKTKAIFGIGLAIMGVKNGESKER